MSEKLEKRFNDWRDLIDVDFPEVKITEETREAMIAYARSHPVSDVRISMGRFYTDEEYRAYRERVMSAPLP